MYTPPESMLFGYGSGIEDVPASFIPFLIIGGHNGVLLGTILPFHAICCLSILTAMVVCGIPGVPRDVTVLRRVFMKTLWRAALPGTVWLTLATFIASFWFHGSQPSWKPPAAPVFGPAIDISARALAMTYVGAFVGYLMCVSHVAKKQLWAATDGTGSASWIRACIKCGYQAEADRACPECGHATPLTLGRFYSSNWQARLCRRRWWADPVEIVFWCAAGALLIWPLISGQWGR